MHLIYLESVNLNQNSENSLCNCVCFNCKVTVIKNKTSFCWRSALCNFSLFEQCGSVKTIETGVCERAFNESLLLAEQW